MSKLSRFAIALPISLILLCGCTPSKPEGFALDESPIRYQTVKFEDPSILAEANTFKITSSQILDKSPVIKDLAEQTNETLVGLVYLKAVDRAAETKSGSAGPVTVYLPESEKPLAQILSRFDRKPVEGVSIVYADPTEEGVLGKYGSNEIRTDDIDRNNAVMQSIEQRRFNETAGQLNQQLSRILLNEEAIREKTSLQDYIDKKVLKGEKVSISEEELNSHLAKIGFAQSELTPELKTQFTESLKQRKEQKLIEAYVAKEILKGPVKVSFGPPTTSLRLNEAWKAIAGSDDAPIPMVAFAGTTCPDCPQFVQTMYKAMNDNEGYVKLNWIHNFNEADGIGRMMAQAALCVSVQKPKKTLEFLNAFSQNASQIDENTFYGWVEKNGVDKAAFKDCFVGQKLNSTVDQHLVYAKQVGIVANPSLWVDGKMLEGVIRPEQLQQLIDERKVERQVSPLRALWSKLIGKFSST